jgi:hypothetical protein
VFPIEGDGKRFSDYPIPSTCSTFGGKHLLRACFTSLRTLQSLGACSISFKSSWTSKGGPSRTTCGFILYIGNAAAILNADTFDIDDEEWRTPNLGRLCMGIMADSPELCSNGSSCSGFIDHRSTIPLARGLLGANHDFGDYTIITRCRSLRIVRAVHGNGAWRSSWSGCGQFLRTEYAYLRCRRFYPGTPERRSKLESECIPIRRCDACRCAACTAGGISVAHRASSIRRSVYRPVVALILSVVWPEQEEVRLSRT